MLRRELLESKWTNNRFYQPQNETGWQKNKVTHQENKMKSRSHGKERCADCLYWSHECNAMLQCGCTIPVIADACSTERRLRMPVTEGYLNGKKVTVLRDSGCSTVVVRIS